MTLTDFVERTRELGGFARAAEAEMAVRATLETLGAVLLPNERRAVSAHLPDEFRKAFEAAERVAESDLEVFYDRVARRERVSAGRSREHVQIVCRVLSEALPWEVVEALRKHVPRLASLFEQPEAPWAPEEIERISHPLKGGAADDRATRTLAGGRPGSRHPLSEARPDRAHTNSVARSDNPHGDTKLSTSHGLTQEREAESLATGRPGPRRPLSG